MHLKIIWDEEAYKELNKLDSFVSKRIEKKILELSEKLYSLDVKKLKGTNYLRLRVGDYRVIFDVQGNTIIILKVGHRRKIYKN